MRHHRWDVADARDAVIAGDLERVRGPFPSSWRETKHRIEDMPQDCGCRRIRPKMEAEASRAAQATTLGEAARGVAAVTQRCGDCHRGRAAARARSWATSSEFDAHGRTGLRGAMAQHVWAAEELWLGMTVPHHESSRAAGAKALSSTPLPPAKETGSHGDAQAGSLDPGPDLTRSDEAMIPHCAKSSKPVRAMGERALAAGQPSAMTRSLLELIARCGDCHAARRHSP